MKKKVQIVGILNTTPDSYVDSGRFVTIKTAIAQAKKFIDEGVRVVEIGGESTGPTSKNVSLEEELQRTIPIIAAIHDHFPIVQLSIDTYKAPVAKAAIEAGVSMVNDITAGRADKDMFAVIATSGIPYVLMYSKDNTPRTTIENKSYKDVIGHIIHFFEERISSAKKAGIRKDQIILDPGLGHFISSYPKYSFEILANLEKLLVFGCPLFISPSRKSFLAGIENLPVKDRLPATIAASAIAFINGATYIRTHDVAEVKRGCEVAEMIIKSATITI
ncbi:MAG TPA: dihydropteroate synthase [Candidatus Andersenbacteria bacterium]|nr:dihydropteroate synthase [Candidatus Andersenbacteria bacterium]